MHRTRTALLVAAAALVGPLAACSGSDDTGLGRPVADEVADPCALLDAPEVDAITGWRVGEGEPTPDDAIAGMSACHFREEDQVGVVQVAVADEAGEATAIAARRELAERHDDVADVTIDGASDAFEVRSAGVIGMVVDDRFVEVAAVGAGLDEGDHVALAELVAGRV